ncbi:MAG: hypothetical protein K8S27_13550 [Candidatus Omnitrophica bacterium]|nr:hypothetical protein [Candidatus Omnitrophota bacterium]
MKKVIMLLIIMVLLLPSASTPANAQEIIRQGQTKSMLAKKEDKNYIVQFDLQINDRERSVQFLTTPTYFSFNEVYSDSSFSVDASLEKQSDQNFYFYYQSKVSELMQGADENSFWVENTYEGNLVLPLGQSIVLYQSGHRKLTVTLTESLQER